jgi:hypothetical protein
MVISKGVCAEGDFKGTFVDLLATFTPDKEHPYNKLDLIAIKSEDGTLAYTMVDHGLDI